MNTTSRKPAEQTELEELRALFAPPAGLPASRRHQLEAHFIREITDTQAASRRPVTAAPQPVPRVRRQYRSVSIAAAAGVIALTVAVIAINGSHAQTAAAAPAPLKIESSLPAVPLARIAARASERADAPGTAERGSHLREWALGMYPGQGQPPVRSVEEYLRRWSADGSGFSQTIEDGHVVHTERYPSGSWQTEGMFSERPPADPAALRSYLSTALHNPEAGTHAYPMLDALQHLLQVWTPGPKETAAITGMLAQQPDLRARGAVKDRLGRQGQMYTVDHNDARDAVILDEHTGKVLDMELSFTRDNPEVSAKAGDVMQYDTYIS